MAQDLDHKPVTRSTQEILNACFDSTSNGLKISGTVNGNLDVAGWARFGGGYTPSLAGDLNVSRQGGTSGYIYFGTGGDRYVGYNGGTGRFLFGNSLSTSETGFNIFSTTNTTYSQTEATIRTLCNTVFENPSASGQTYLGASFNGVLKSAWRFDYGGNINYESSGYHAIYCKTSTFADTVVAMGTATGFAVGEFSASPPAQFYAVSASTGRISGIIRAIASQTVDILQVQKSDASVQFAVTKDGNTVLGAQAALATNATNGFTYIPTSAGAPTGIPTSYTGKVAMQYDTTNNKIYIYNGAWKAVTLA